MTILEIELDYQLKEDTIVSDYYGDFYDFSTVYLLKNKSGSNDFIVLYVGAVVPQAI